ncbi:MAG: hypothetical protein JRI23_33635 [Deltaproteobacteria bacterium]|jgi:hypothetical protein|nr:hypothetical protein [Deltaproteobacteria bacterium]MBW2537224.1 hypothetical protein [Deltaproteobacteria bacterium]
MNVSKNVSNSLRNRLARRGAERGAAVFVVVLIVTVLSALGLFAVRSAALANTTAGYSRQMTQSHYVTEYGVSLAAGELGGPARQNYAEEMRSGTHTGCDSLSTVSNATCFQIHGLAFEKRIDSLQSGAVLILADGLGLAANEGAMLVELTELRPRPNMRGMALTGLGAEAMPRYHDVTVTATGQVRPQSTNPNQCDAISRQAAGVEMSRAHLIVGPLTP